MEICLLCKFHAKGTLCDEMEMTLVGRTLVTITVSRVEFSDRG